MIFIGRSCQVLSASRPMGLLWNTLRAFIHFPSSLRETIICYLENNIMIPKAPSKESNLRFEMQSQEMVIFIFQSWLCQNKINMLKMQYK